MPKNDFQNAHTRSKIRSEMLRSSVGARFGFLVDKSFAEGEKVHIAVKPKKKKNPFEM